MLPDDVKSLVVSCLAHRMVVQPEHFVSGLRPEGVLTDLLREIEIPLAEFDD